MGYLLADHISAMRRCPRAVVAVMLGRSPIPVNCHVLPLQARPETAGPGAIFLFRTTTIQFSRNSFHYDLRFDASNSHHG